MPLSSLASMWLASAVLAPSALSPDEVDMVEVPWSRVQAMRAAVAEAPTTPGPWVAEREVELTAVEGGLLLHGRWTVKTEQAGWLGGRLLGPGIELRHATWDGATAPVVTLPGSTAFALWVERDAVLEVRAFVPQAAGTREDRISLELLPASRGRLRVTAPGRAPAPLPESSGRQPPVLDGGVIWSGAPTVALHLRDPDQAPPTRQTLAVAHAGIGLTVGDAELRGHAHLQWELRQGSLSKVRATVSGLGEDLQLEGRDVATWTRNGDTLEVELAAPASGRVDLDLRWSVAVPSGDEARLPVPRIEPEAWRTESSLQLARDGEIEVVPDVSDARAIAASELPVWGQGLVEGTPTAAYQSSQGAAAGGLDLLRFVPVSGPPTVVDVATYTVATTEEGRVLMKAYYALRNDRGAQLTVHPPAGMRIVGARVAGETALPSRGDEGAWRLPLKRSLETVEGLLSFPVEVIFIGEQDQWARRERRELPLPTLDAPIAAARVTLYLPPQYDSRLETGEHNVVADFGEGEGLTYGFGGGDDVETGVADALFQEAVQGYLENDFESAQDKLAQLEALGVDNENMSRLQANLDVIEGRADEADKGDLTLQRRVKEQAKARAAEDFRQQEVLVEEAERAAQAGDYAAAEAQYAEALELGGKLAKLEQTESVEQQSRNAALQAELEAVNERRKKSASGKKKGKAKQRAVLDTKFKNEDADEDEATGSDGQAATGSESDGRTYQRPRLSTPRPSGNLTEILDPVAATTTTNGADESRRSSPPPPPAPPSPGMGGGGGGAGQGPPPPPTMGPGGGEAPISASTPPADDPAPPEITVDQDGVVDELDVYEDETNYDYDEPAAAHSEEWEPEARRRFGRRRRSNRSRGSRSFNGGSDRGVLEGEPIVRKEHDRRTARRERRSRGLGGLAGGSAPKTAEQVYDFEDDNVDGEILRPEGANLASRARASFAGPEPLPRPKVTASALSVVIPATGQAVRYEQLLIDANQTQTISIDARRRLRRR